jgi:hypothetical protein
VYEGDMFEEPQPCGQKLPLDEVRRGGHPPPRKLRRADRL